MPTRKEIADGLKQAAASYLLKKGFACHFEIGLMRRGRLKADVLSINLRGDIVLIEVKSCPADYKTDSKWQSYLQYSNKMYFCFTEDCWKKLPNEAPALKKLGVGVLLLDTATGYLKCAISSPRRSMSGKVKRELTIRLAWRSAEVSKRTSRRKRVFL